MALFATTIAILIFYSSFKLIEKGKAHSSYIIQNNEEITQNNNNKNIGIEEKQREYKISWASWTPIKFKENNSWGEKCIEEYFPDVDIQFIHFDKSTWEIQLSALIASGTYPDAIRLKDRTMIYTYVRQGVLAKAPYSVVKENAGRYIEAMEETGVDHWLTTLINGTNYGIPVLNVRSGSDYCNVWRSDWLESTSIYKIPDTLEEYEEAFRKFTLEDPDENGIDDTFAYAPIGTEKDIQYQFNTIFAAHGVFPFTWMVMEDGTYKYGLVMEEAREAMRRLNSWYKNGYIDPDFMKNDAEIAKAKLLNGKSGFREWRGIWEWRPPRDGGNAGYEYAEALKLNPNCEFKMGYPPEGSSGKRGLYDWGNVTGAVCFGKHLDNELQKMGKIIQILELFATNEEAAIKLEYGIEGEHYIYDSVTGSKNRLPPYDSGNEGWTLLSPNGLFGWSRIREVSDALQDNYIVEDFGWNSKNTLLAGINYIPYVNQFVDLEMLKYQIQAREIADIWELEFITGSKSLDDDWYEFIKAWKESGGEIVTQQVNMMARKAIEENLQNIESSINAITK
mgnify:CR=1 FL=1